MKIYDPICTLISQISSLKKSMSLFIPTSVWGLQFFYFMNLTDKVTATIEKWCFYMKVAIGGNNILNMSLEELPPSLSPDLYMSLQEYEIWMFSSLLLKRIIYLCYLFLTFNFWIKFIWPIDNWFYKKPNQPKYQYCNKYDYFLEYYTK